MPVFDKWNIHELDVYYMTCIILTVKECNIIKSLDAVTMLCDMMINSNFCVNFYLFYPHNLKNHHTLPHITFYNPWASGDMKTVLYESERGTFMLRVLSLSLKSNFFFLVQVTPVTSPLIDCNVMTSYVPAWKCIIPIRC